MSGEGSEAANRIRVIGPGRAGGALQAGLAWSGWNILNPLGRGDDLTHACEGVDLLVIATPDDSIAQVAAQVEPVASTVVVHLAGSLGLDVLDTHERRGAIHPLVSIPVADTDIRGCWFAVAGDPMTDRVVDALDGRSFRVADEHRASYHAAACIASNHLVALMGQVARIAHATGVPFEPFIELAKGALEQVQALGPNEALTGPAQRGDVATITRHLEALDPSERPAYEALMQAAKRLASPRTDL